MKTIKNVTAQKRIIFLPSGNLKIEPGRIVSVNATQAKELEEFFKSKAGKMLVDGKFLLIDSKADIQTHQKTPNPPADLNPVVGKGSAVAAANTEIAVNPKAEKKIAPAGSVTDAAANA